MRLRDRLLFLLGILPLLLTGTAHADTIVTPWIGRVFSGDLRAFDSDRGESHLAYGASLAFLGRGPLGFEVDAGYIPRFFGPTATTGKNNHVTLMANLVLSVPVTDAVRLYASGGGGIMKSNVEDPLDPSFDVNQNDLGVDAGGGVMLKLGDRFGVRGDLRYFRDVQTRTDDLSKVDFGGLHYWRGAAGVTLRF